MRVILPLLLPMHNKLTVRMKDGKKPNNTPIVVNRLWQFISTVGCFEMSFKLFAYLSHMLNMLAMHFQHDSHQSSISQHGIIMGL